MTYRRLFIKKYLIILQVYELFSYDNAQALPFQALAIL